ncbi:MAG: helix-turn-helix domain-containing protein [Clostridiales bacterium]|nr:helix-turn-helix domain-containing protein [Clostridiales bacterium]
MILAEKITLLRKKAGWSQEDLAEQLGVSRQSISKWESAQSVPDLKRILDIADCFGISTDVLLKDDIELEETIPSYPEGSADHTGTGSGYPADELPLRQVSMEEANDYLSMKAISSGRIALGVMLCILSPVVLILLGGGQETGLLALTENQAAGIGILILMLMVGAAVGLFVFYGMKMKPYEYISKEPIETAYGVHGMVAERLQNYQKAHSRYMVIGILLCVLSCIPIFLALIVNPDNDMIGVLAVSVLLVMIGIGVLLIVRTSIIMEGLQALLEEGEFSRDNKNESRRNETVMGIYWMSTTAIYLAASFLTKRWDITWVIWPVAGVGCGILAAVLKVIRSKE